MDTPECFFRGFLLKTICNWTAEFRDPLYCIQYSVICFACISQLIINKSQLLQTDPRTAYF